MKKVSFADMRCSLARSLDVVGDWWTLLIVRDVFLGIGRFDDLVADLGISRNLLTERLKRLVERGIVERVAYSARPARYEYRLGEAGRDLVPVVLALTSWGDRWAAPDEGRPMRFVHRSCGYYCDAAVNCSCCGRPLASDNVDIVPGPGGAAGPGTWVVARRLAAASGGQS